VISLFESNIVPRWLSRPRADLGLNAPAKLSVIHARARRENMAEFQMVGGFHSMEKSERSPKIPSPVRYESIGLA
jgi:hypothetical protein